MSRRAGTILIASMLLAILALQARLWFGEGSLRHVASLRKQVSELEAENAVLADRNRLMVADVEDLKSGLDKIEEIARRDLGMIREGETFYRVLDADRNEQRNRAGERNADSR
ncbi:septum formation initiator family protein [Alcanivorax sp. JB21]|uniref:FtsB family cell division protein n=1 Tax=Alcanivorax limicola TaxID=2874102 RepID=UPI001CBEDAC9|nr:septum formation initiator family protein [Alcanivorax limicola]MBZ2188383.1 septum formation initiator family protein [Alcanivorax limicola]